jgi:hypothetical protein
VYDRELLVEVLTYHQQRSDSSCICGWARLGALHPEHVADAYEANCEVRLAGEVQREGRGLCR